MAEIKSVRLSVGGVVRCIIVLPRYTAELYTDTLYIYIYIYISIYMGNFRGKVG